MAQRPPANIPLWQVSLSLPPTHLLPYARQFSMFMRWLVVLTAPILPLLNPVGMPGLAAVLLLGLAYATLLALLERAGQHPPLWVAATLDVGYITLLVFFRDGLLSNVFLLYTVVLIYLTMAYAWRGTVAALILIFCAYLPALALVHGMLGIELDDRAPSALFIRLFYMTLVGWAMGMVVAHFQRAHRELEQARALLADRVRRLEAIQRISQSLHALTSVPAIGEVIANATRDVIPYGNCRVHVWRDGPDGVTLPLIGLYGEDSDAKALRSAHLAPRLGEGITGWVAAHAEPVLLDDATGDPRGKHIPGTAAIADSLLVVPLCAEGRVKGVIVMSKLGTRQFSEDDKQLLITLANSAAVALENAETRQLLAQQARTDPITGLPHHGAYQIALALALAEAQQTGEAVALALLDLDNFRNYNDRLGIQAGDACLERVGRLLDRLTAAATGPAAPAPAAGDDGSLPPPASAYRIGGDEFALLLRGNLAGELAALSSVRRVVQAIAELHAEEPIARITASAGLAFYPADAARRQTLVDLADAALYLVRQTGGNRLGRVDAATSETLALRHNLDALVHTSLAEAGSDGVVAYLLSETSALQQQLRHSSLTERLTTEALRALAAAIDAKDDYTRGHSDRVAAISAEIATFMGCPGDDVTRIATAAQMHDIGKIGVPDHLLHKGRELTPDERETVARHPDVGADILRQIHTLADVVPIVRHHHERVDGQGYPGGLQAEEIPFGARVLAVADALDAMITDRPYRRGMDVADALAELQRHVGTHFWGPVVAAAIALYGPDGSGLALRGLISAEAVLGEGVRGLGAVAGPDLAQPAPRPDPFAIAMNPEPVAAPRRVTASSAPNAGSVHP